MRQRAKVRARRRQETRRRALQHHLGRDGFGRAPAHDEGPAGERRHREEAAREGLDKGNDTQYLLELTRLNVLQQTVEQRYLKDRKPTDAELKAEYDSDMAQAPKMEYHAAHILVATEPFAEKVIQRLDRGEKFEDLAKVESMDPSKKNGGDLGWLRAGVPPQLINALSGLKPGEQVVVRGGILLND